MVEFFNNKFYPASVFVTVLILFFIFVFIPSVKKINTDFPNYYVSANMFLDGKDLRSAYDNVEFNKQILLYGIENQFSSFIPYPPVNALLMIPFARQEPLMAKLLWNILNMVFFLLSIYFISRISELSYIITGILFFISGYAFVNNFFFGQAYILVLLLFSASLYFLFKENDLLSALFFSISVLLKFYTIFFIILFLCRKKFKLVSATILFIILLNVIVFSITGWDINLFYYTVIMPRISDGWVGTVYAPEFQSVVSLLHILFYSEPSLNPDPLIQSSPLYYILKYFFYFGVLLSSVFIVLNPGIKKDSKTFKLQISLFCFVCMLLLPVNASYQYVILIPAIAIIVNYYVMQKKYYTAGSLLVLFFIMNSPISVYIVSITKSKPYFFLGYVKLFILIYFWLVNIIILKKGEWNVTKNPILRYSYLYAFLILIFSKLSLALSDSGNDDSHNILINQSYLISMPSSYEEKLVYTICNNEKFILNSNFGTTYKNENVFEPRFTNENEIVYSTIVNRKQIFKKLNLIDLRDSISGNVIDTLASTGDNSLKCYSENGQIYLKDDVQNKITQMTSGNSLNIRPVLDKNNSKIIFCSDRNRGVGFTTLYEIKINK